MQTVVTPPLQEATHSLIENLLASEAFIEYQEAHARLNADSESSALLEQLTQAQARVRQKQGQGGTNEAELDSLRLLQQRVQRNPVIMTYARSQQDAINFLREINTEISQPLGVNFATVANHSTC